MNRRTMTRRGVRLALALALSIADAGLANAASTQCVGCFAALDANAHVLRSRGVVSAKKIQNGVYEVVFSKLVTKCAYTATPGFPFSADIEFVRPSIVVAVADSGSNATKGVIVQTFSATGELDDREFYLTLTCQPN